MTRGARAERQAKLRLLEAVRVETEVARQQLDERHAALPAMRVEQAEEIVARIAAMSAEDITRYFEDFRVRSIPKTPVSQARGGPGSPFYEDDQELAAAVEAVNRTLCAYDSIRLNLRIAEFYDGQVIPPAPEADSSLIKLDILSVFIRAAKLMSFEESLKGGDPRTIERENFEPLWLTGFRPDAGSKAEEQVTHLDEANAVPPTDLVQSIHEHESDL